MTYMPEANISSSATDDEASTLEKLKTLTQEGKERTQRISKILRQAFSETREEFQAGQAVISPLAKEVTTETVSSVKNKSQAAAEAVNQAWQDEANTSDTTERFINAIKKLLNQAKVAATPIAKQQAIKLNEILSNRYGTQYTTLRDRFEIVRSWMSAAQTVSQPPVDTPSVEIKMDESHSTAAIEVDSETVH